MQAIGGAELSICDADYAPFMAQMADSLRADEPMIVSATPVMSSVIVYATAPDGDRVEQVDGWTLDETSLRLTFSAPLVLGTFVEVYYDVAAVAE